MFISYISHLLSPSLIAYNMLDTVTLCIPSYIVKQQLKVWTKATLQKGNPNFTVYTIKFTYSKTFPLNISKPPRYLELHVI